MADHGVLTCVRLPQESGKVPVRLLFRNFMELSCSTDRGKLKPHIQWQPCLLM